MSKKKKAKKLNIHHLLRDYHDRDDYGLIVRTAAQAVQSGALEADEEAVMAWATAQFGPPPTRLKMRANAAPLSIFGEVETHIPMNALDQMYTVLRLPVATRGHHARRPPRLRHAHRRGGRAGSRRVALVRRLRHLVHDAPDRLRHRAR